METEANLDTMDEVPLGNRRRWCCCFPFSSSWEPIDSAAAAAGGDDRGRWWGRSGAQSLMMKAREWSELTAGPKWKTFLRRFGRNPNRGRAAGGMARFQYDPLSYTLNFDEGQGVDTPEGGYAFSRDFSARFVAPPHAPLGNSAVDLGGRVASSQPPPSAARSR